MIDDAIAYAKEHKRSARDYEGKGELLRKNFGKRPAEDVTADEIATWIRRREVAPATFNRYRAFFSLCYREGIRSGKVKTNPARLLKQKKEPRGRKRFLSREEYGRVLLKVQELYPQHVPAFIVSIFTGMRLSEQYGLCWKHVDLKGREIHLTGTKNDEDRTIPMASVVHEALSALKPVKVVTSDLVFSRPHGGTGAV